MSHKSSSLAVMDLSMKDQDLGTSFGERFGDFVRQIDPEENELSCSSLASDGVIEIRGRITVSF